MSSQSLKTPEPLTCWHCNMAHSTTRDFCAFCNGWTLPTQFKPQPSSILEDIHWTTFVIAASDSEATKRRLMEDAVAAMDSDEYVAILGILVKKEAEKTKTAVFVHRPGGDKRLSIFKTKIHSSARWWSEMCNTSWEAFKSIVGVATTYELLEFFPQPVFPEPDSPYDTEEE